MTDAMSKAETEAMNFLGAMSDKLEKMGNTNDSISNEKLLELINVIDERTMDIISSMGNDMARLLINLTALVQTLIDNNTTTEDEFSQAVHKTALEFRESMEKNGNGQATNLDDIEL